MFPSTDAYACSVLSSGGYRGRHHDGGPAVPHLPRYYDLIRLLTIHPESLWSPLVCGTPPGYSLRSCPGCIRPRTGHGSFQVNHASVCQGRWQALPGSWGTPLIACPGLGTPAAPDNLALAVVRVLPSARLIASASATTKDFGADSSRPATSLCTPHPKGHPSRCNTRYRPARYGFDRAGFPPAGSH